MKRLISVLCIFSMLCAVLGGCAFTLTTDENEKDSANSPQSTSQSEAGGAPAKTLDSKSLYITGIDEQIAMRESDDDIAGVVAQLSLGDEVKLVSSDSALYYCVLQESTGAQGYVKRAYLTDEKSAVCKAETCYAAKKTSLYDTKESDHNEIEKLDAGTAVTVLAKTSGDFWFVGLTSSKTYGYVKCMELSTSKPTASSAASSKTASKSTSAASKKQTYTTGSGSAPTDFELYYAKVNSGYLAIRNAKAFDSSNEIGKMYTGDAVYVVDKSTGTYWYCYSPNVGVYGYVNSDYLVSYYPGTTAKTYTNNGYTVWTVSVASGYLAMRSSAARANDTNVIGKLYSGNQVYVYSDSYINFTDTYWYVYSPSLGIWGYVDSNYIYS